MYEAARAVVPNRGELAQLTGLPVATTNDGLVDQARLLGCSGAVIITLGPDGALIVEHDQVVAVPARRVDAIDTTAAGDSFCGALADALVGGASTRDAVAWATRAASVTVTRRGAQVSLPTRADLAD
ncbi:MAG: PfkB family carbohydrate kinase [Acidimicrobiales bacterium]